MRSRLSVLAAVCLAVAVGACAPAAEVEPAVDEAAMTEAAVAAIEALFEQYSSTLATGDAEGWYSLSTADCVWMMPEGENVSGVDALREYAQPYFDDFDMEEPVTPAEIRVAGDWAFASGAWTSRFVPKAGGDATESRGSFGAVVERGPDGTWRFARFVWTRGSGAAAAEAEAEAEAGM